MKQISEFILEQLDCINESIASTIVNKWLDTYKSNFDFRLLKRSFQWDKITDEDLQEFSTYDAKKLAYKRNSTQDIFWCDENDIIIGWTSGNFRWNVFDYGKFHKIKSIMPIINAADHAYIVDEKFSTNDLRKTRKEARENALALKTEEQVRKENIVRYQNILRDKKIEDGSMFADIKARFEITTERYNSIFENLDPMDEKNFSLKIEMLKNISKAYVDVLNNIESLKNQYDYEKNNTNTFWNPMTEMKSYFEKCDVAIAKFNSLFTE